MGSQKKMGLGRPGAAERVKVGRSPIHGRGLFAARRIRPGAYVASFEGVATQKNGMHVLWTLDEDDNEVGIDGRNDLRFLNHSGDPNTEFIGNELHALRNIQVGAELTIHYGDDWEQTE
jgi:SET domain-containing protein